MARRNTETNEEDRKRKITLQGVRRALRIFRYIKPYRWQFVLGLFLLMGSSLTVMVFPYVTGKLVDASTGDYPTLDRNSIALGLIGILLVQALLSFMRVLLFSRVSEQAMRDIRKDLYGRMIRLPITFFENHRVGELTSRLTSDVSQLQDVLAFVLAEFLRQVLTLLVGLSIIMVTSTRLTLVMISTFPVMIIGAIVFGRFIRQLSKKVQDELAAANTVVEETFQSINSVKAFTNEGFESGRYEGALNRVLGNALRAAKFRGAFISFVIFAIFGGIVLVMWYGLGLVAEREITIGSLVSFIIYTTFIGGAVGGMGDLYSQLQRTLGASERLLDILDQAPELPHETVAGKLPRLRGQIQFRQVKFNYPTRPDVPVLRSISLDIDSGSKVALVGHSGAGKSTIAALLLRLYDWQGDILIDGQDSRRFDLGHLRSNIGIVPQEVLLFGGTIYDNIAYGRPGATPDEVRAAAEKANAMEFISQFPEGLQTLVGERGIKLSGGQRQRIAIARAVLKDPAILILDEATSSLDAESEQLVQQALDQLMEGRTTLIIAHRLATIRKADQIFVIDAGQVIEQGTHEELLQHDAGLYATLVQLQFQL